MFLPTLLRWLRLLALAAIVFAAAGRAQVPAEPFAVVAADAEVSARSLDTVRAAVRRGLTQLDPQFPGGAREPFTVAVHSGAAALPPGLAEAHHPGSPGFALLDSNQIHILMHEVMGQPLADLHAVVVHELVHILLHQHCESGGGTLPRWFHEGLAQVLAGDTYLGAGQADLVWRVGVGRLPAFSDLIDDFPHGRDDLRTAYAMSHSYVAFLVREVGIEGVMRMARMVDARTTFDRAQVIVSRESTASLADRWREYLVHDSGARSMVLLENCFTYLMIGALPLLALAMIRRQRLDRRAHERIALSEDAEPAMPEPMPETERETEHENEPEAEHETEPDEPTDHDPDADDASPDDRSPGSRP